MRMVCVCVSVYVSTCICVCTCKYAYIFCNMCFCVYLSLSQALCVDSKRLRVYIKNVSVCASTHGDVPNVHTFFRVPHRTPPAVRP